jgi:hypothetical protein
MRRSSLDRFEQAFVQRTAEELLKIVAILFGVRSGRVCVETITRPSMVISWAG